MLNIKKTFQIIPSSSESEELDERSSSHNANKNINLLR